jgi:hypothetical protein
MEPQPFSLNRPSLRARNRVNFTIIWAFSGARSASSKAFVSAFVTAWWRHPGTAEAIFNTAD